MALFTKDSIETLRQSIDLVEVLGAYLDFKRTGSSYKALCPFHEEKSPSFIVQRGEHHYHCYGCGAHGDAIAFLMSHVKMSFVEAAESLAERFGVILEKAPHLDESSKGPNKTALKQALERAAEFYHFLLLYSLEGREALHYLYKRGINLAFIRHFQLGYAPKEDISIKYLLLEGVKEEELEQSGLLSSKKRPFFTQRILFPIRDAFSAVIGFSGRKFKEETYGGKYINTPETPLFKKSHVLFGLSYSRSRIAKEKKVIVVEGQIDALRLIFMGFDYTVAGQGTAFGQEHVKELVNLGVNKAYLALDGDDAGREAAAKIGALFQQKGVDVFITALSKGEDPDTLLLSKGPQYFFHLLQTSQDYLSFLFQHLSKGESQLSPSQKNEIVKQMSQTIRSWQEPVMVHESLKRLSQIAHIPENTLEQIPLPDLFIRKNENVPFDQVNPDRILETDLLRWLFLAGPQISQVIRLCKANLQETHFRIHSARLLYAKCLVAYEEKGASDLLTLGSLAETQEEQQLLGAIMQRKINLQKIQEGCKETIRNMLLRSWMDQREAIRVKIHNSFLTDEQALQLAKEFDTLKTQIPQVVESD